MQLGQRAQPVMRVPGQAYGAQADQVRQQQALPVATQPTPTPAAAPMPAPTQVIPLDAPTQRPNEPVTSGIDLGPGAPAPQQQLIENPDLIRQWMPMLERIASQPDASTQTRNFVRFLRSNI